MYKCVAFEVWGEYGHFRKFYTTSSPLTHAFPPVTAIWGMIGAIIGLDKDCYLKKFQLADVKCGVQIVSPVIKTRIAVNLIDTKASRRFLADTSQHTQISMELLKRPKYRIYFYHPDTGIYSTLKSSLEEQQTHYTLCLGLSEHIAQFRYLGEFMMEQISDNNEKVNIIDVVPTDKIRSYEIGNNLEYFKETVPAGMDILRRPTGYQEVLYERNGHPILCIPSEYYRLETKENVIFL